MITSWSSSLYMFSRATVSIWRTCLPDAGELLWAPKSPVADNLYVVALGPLSGNWVTTGRLVYVALSDPNHIHAHAHLHVSREKLIL